MSENNKATVRRFLRVIHEEGKVDRLPEFVTEGYVNHSPSWPDVVGLEAFGQMQGAVRAAFPDLKDTVKRQYAEGDTVVTHWVMSGTHQAEWLGVAATGKRITVEVASISHFDGNRVDESWDYVDMLGMMQQMGAIPEAGS